MRSEALWLALDRAKEAGVPTLGVHIQGYTLYTIEVVLFAVLSDVEACAMFIKALLIAHKMAGYLQQVRLGPLPVVRLQLASSTQVLRSR